MELLSIKCPSCTAITAVNPSRAQALCQYCGTILETEKPRSVGLTNSSEDGVGFVALRRVEEQYFNNEKQFKDVLAAYTEMELAEARNANYWLARARFYAKGSLKEFEEGRVSEDHRSEIVDQYILWMETAIAKHSGIAFELKVEKEKTIGDINNALGGKKRKEEAEANLENDYQQVVMMDDDEDELDDDELEENTAKSKKFKIIITIVGVVLLLLIGFLLLRSCGNNAEDEYNVEYYEEFLELSYVLDLFNDDATRSDILDLSVDFGDQDTDNPTLRVTAPEVADLNSIVFHFDEDDILTQLLITNAEYFNGFAANEGFADDLTQHIEANFAEELELEDDVLSFEIDEFVVVLTLRSDQFSINVSRAGNELTAEQQEIWDLIEARIEEGYDSWADLIAWADEQDIPFLVGEDGERPIDAILSLINDYGLVGDYTYATPKLDLTLDPFEVVLFLHFENLTYNETIAELSSLNRNSGRELSSWLTNGGLERLELHFEDVEILVFDDEGELITEMPEVVEFVNWELEFFDRFMPMGEGSIRIERIYRILEVEMPEEEEEEEEEEEDEEEEPSGPTTLDSGDWVVGVDIPQGRYTITGDGSGNFFVWRGDSLILNEVLGGAGVGSITTYLLNGDEIEISGVRNVRFNPVANRTLSRTLGAGNWVVGVDIEEGDFEATAPSGSGSLIIWRGGTLRTNEVLDDGTFGEERVSVSLANGDIITISGLERVNFE